MREVGGMFWSHTLAFIFRDLSERYTPMGDSVAMVRGTIKVNSKTAGHEAWLKERGYAVTAADGALSVSGTCFLETLDLSGPDEGVAVLKEVVRKNQLLTYSTRVLTNKGVRFGFPLLGVLGKASALVVSPASGSKASSGGVYDSI